MYIRGDHIKKPIPHVVFEIVLNDWTKNKHCSMITNHILGIKHTYFQFKLLCLFIYVFVCCYLSPLAKSDGARIYLEIYERMIQASSSNGDFMYCELYPLTQRRGAITHQSQAYLISPTNSLAVPNGFQLRFSGHMTKSM